MTDEMPSDATSPESSIDREQRRKRERAARAERLENDKASAEQQLALERKLIYSHPPQFGDSDQQRDYDREVLRAKTRQTYEYAIAPRARVVSLRGGRELLAGQEITRDDVGGDGELLGRLVALGTVIHIDPHTLKGRQALDPKQHSHVVVRSLTSSRGILVPGEGVSASDFARPGEPERLAEPGQIDERGNVRPAKLAMPARPGVDGRAIVRDLERRGLLRPVGTDGDDGEPPRAA